MCQQMVAHSELQTCSAANKLTSIGKPTANTDNKVSVKPAEALLSRRQVVQAKTTEMAELHTVLANKAVAVKCPSDKQQRYYKQRQ